MMRGVLLLLFALPAAAQQAPSEPARAPEAVKTPERPALNLRLDNPSSFATVRPPEKESAKGLPTLGGDARVINPGGSNAPSRDPIPKDTNPGR
jgi:hypothetical protein